ncbi:hypothetical protein Efla_001352 [Eimeria flavescens]
MHAGPFPGLYRIAVGIQIGEDCCSTSSWTPVKRVEMLGITADLEGSSVESGVNEVVTFLHRDVAEAVTAGIAAIIKAKPKDVLLFFSCWLRRYVNQKRSRLEANEFRKALSSAQCSLEGRQESLEAGTSAAQACFEKHHLGAADNEALRALREAEWVDEELIERLLDYMREALDATGVYLTKYIDHAAQREGEMVPGLRYIATDKTHCCLLGQCLLEDEGATWELLRDDEALGSQGENARAVEASDDEDDEGVFNSLTIKPENAHRLDPSVNDAFPEETIRHKVLFVEEVMDDPRIRFFGLTRPGSYIAVSFEFSDVASSESIALLCNWLQQKQEREDALVAAREESEGESDAEADGVAEGPEGFMKEFEDLLPPIQLPSAPAKYILCVDFLGKDTCSRQTAPRIQAFASALATAFVKTHKKAVERQAHEVLQEARISAELVELLQRSSDTLEALKQVRQAEALQRLDEEEASEAKPLERDRKASIPVEKGFELSFSSETNSNGMENLTDARSGQKSNQAPDEEVSEGEERLPEEDEWVPLPREFVLDAVAAQAALEAFNKEVLSVFRPKFSLGNRPSY